MTDEQRKQFEIMVKEGIEMYKNNSIEDLAYPQSDEIEPPSDIGQIFSPEGLSLNKKKIPKLDEKIIKQTKILECALQTDEYLGYLKGMKIKCRLDGNHYEAGFYQGKYDRFVRDNTP